MTCKKCGKEEFFIDIGLDDIHHNYCHCEREMKNKCTWKLDCNYGEEIYVTSCNQMHLFIDGTPQENHYNYCPYCGKEIIPSTAEALQSLKAAGEKFLKKVKENQTNKQRFKQEKGE